MKTFGNRAIAASAGTGKTWALSHRYLALMVAGVEPDRICALTFSRKAAGEIFESIVTRLCLSATHAEERETTGSSMAKQVPGIDLPQAGEAYVHLLRRLLDAGHRLRIGTLDSFLLGIVRAFPLELGIPPDCRPMDNDGGEATAQRQALLARIFDPGRSAGAAGANDTINTIVGAAMLDAFRQATYGSEVKSLVKRLDIDIAQYHDVFRRHAARDWGNNPDRIWPPSTRWWDHGDDDDLRRATDDDYPQALCQAWTGTRGTQLGEACARVALAAATHTAETAWPDRLPSVFGQLIAAASLAAPPTLHYYKTAYPFAPALWPPMRAALANLVRVELGRALRQTSGLHALLAQYDTCYREAQQTDGGMTFSDVTRLLSEPTHHPSRDSRAADKLYIDYRLDGRLDHWLLDEFQDTSDDQWHAIANLIDEVAQDPDRSFFYVGDIKQSIYGWRNGNWRLFDEVRKRCGIAHAEHMVDCHRSRPAIIDTVNAVFDGLPHVTAALDEATTATGPHAGAVRAFVGESGWPTHRAVTDPSKGAGFAALLAYEPKKKQAAADDGDGEDAGDAAQYEGIANILGELPLRGQGFSVAVLVRSNQQGRACADTLRRRLPGIPITHEGVGGIVDNPVVTLLLALVKQAAHPADTLTRRHLEMSPLAEGCDPGWLAALPTALLADSQERGFAPALRAWGDRLVACGALKRDDAFGQQRLREFLAAAEQFDTTGSRDADALIAHIHACQVKAQASAGAVRVMTIHQSKGLGFDVVFVPFDPRARSFANQAGVKLLIDETASAAGGWVLRMPKREALLAADGAPAHALDAARADANFEQLCGLYVALTRAKSALYLLVPQANKKTTSVRPADLLHDRLGAADGACDAERHGMQLLYARGNPDWYRDIGAKPREAPQTPAEPLPLHVPFVTDIVRREPSKEHASGRPVPAAWLFSQEAGDVPAFGQALHRLFQRIEWIEDADIEAILTAWRAESDESPGVLHDVEKQFRECLASAAARACLGKPPGAIACDVWREVPFSLVRDGETGPEIVSGRFDRVTITRDDNGQAQHAAIIDFKSNRIQAEAELAQTAEGYRAQMLDYAAAAARLLGLNADQVEATILFTRVGRAWSVTGD